MKTDCKRALALINLLIDGRLAPAERDSLDDHLAGCPSCTAALDDDRRLSAEAAQWARPGVGDDPGDRFNAAILKRIASDPAPKNALSPALGWGFAACLALIVFGAALPWHLPAAAFQAPQMPQLSSALPDLSPPQFSSFSPAGLTTGISLPQWTLLAILFALAVNAWFVLRAARPAREAR